MNEHQHHEHHHDVIAERRAAFEVLPRRSGLDKRRRREAYKKASWALSGHLRCCHGWKHIVGPPLSIDALERLHKQYHEESMP